MGVGRSARVTLVWLCFALGIGCRGNRAPPAPPDTRPGEALRRYWLRDAELLDSPGGRAVRTVDAPILIELSQDGGVRKADGTGMWLGYLPEALLQTPEPGHGLMLYAQRVGELHLDSPSGPVIGRLHPGAVVTVARDYARSVLVSNLGFLTGMESPSQTARATYRHSVRRSTSSVACWG